MIGHSTRAFISITVFAMVVAGAQSTQAASQFDGKWVGHGVTKTGGCPSTFKLDGRIVNGSANSPNGEAAMRVTPSGAMTLTVKLGLNHGAATGQLLNDSGSGTWRAQGPGGTCSGTWTAERE
jgi:hypothetical protein